MSSLRATSSSLASFDTLLRESIRRTRPLLWSYTKQMLALLVGVYALRLIGFIALELGSNMSHLSVKIPFIVLACVGFVGELFLHYCQQLLPVSYGLQGKVVLKKFMGVVIPLIRRFVMLFLLYLLYSGIGISLLGVLCLALQAGELMDVVGWALFALGIISAIVMAPRMWFAALYLLEENLSANVCMKKSFMITKGRWWAIVSRMFLYGLTLLGIVLGGLIAGGVLFGLGLVMKTAGSTALMVVMSVLAALSLVTFFVIAYFALTLLGGIFAVELWKSLKATKKAKKA